MGIARLGLLGEKSVKVYLSGAIKGDPNFKPKFNAAANRLRMQGHEVFNPAAANLDDLPLRRIFEHELGWICREAEAIALIPGYENSEGVAAELATAIALGLEVIEL